MNYQILIAVLLSIASLNIHTHLDLVGEFNKHMSRSNNSDIDEPLKSEIMKALDKIYTGERIYLCPKMDDIKIINKGTVERNNRFYHLFRTPYTLKYITVWRQSPFRYMHIMLDERTPTVLKLIKHSGKKPLYCKAYDYYCESQELIRSKDHYCQYCSSSRR